MYVNAVGLQKTYVLGQTKVAALKGLDLRIDKGEFTAVIGASGSGKTTLLNLIGCIDRPDSGEIVIDDISVGKLNENELSDFRNQKIGFIFQSFNLLPVLTVYENIELPLCINPKIPTADRKAKILSAIEDVGLLDYIHHVPDKLSGGQRQRVAIARAMVTQPALVLADEPTANLDSSTAHKIIDLMQALNHTKKVTFLFSTHDEKLMGRVTRVIRISDGLVVPTEKQ